ncbi:class I SAM-dependent methyltransferase [Rhizobium sp. 2MFCol3.1]|uniref:class I SAM-dependent methyltransferase n=1 Tax=Rhizobium sp. 2MFCol3.1 TaxID=1246459 RepID=UPI000380EB8A|nr:class I SAM-dependent methyltransferase [Rhizobium sp. 2MFCol3.1]
MQARSSNSKLVDSILEACGHGKLLECGGGTGMLLPEFVSRGVDASIVVPPGTELQHIHSAYPARCLEGSSLKLPFLDEQFETVVSIGSLDTLAKEDIPAALREIYRVSSRYAFLRVSTAQTQIADQMRAQRDWWETRCFEAGFRKHPLFYQVNPYESLNTDGEDILIVLEKAPRAALQTYDLMVLVEERLLHTDMLRETGRRSDAHCIRYHKAAEYIRPGDRVLDVACGLGYGSHILYNASKARSVMGIDLSEFSVNYANAHYSDGEAVRFEVGDAQYLSQVPDNSIDFITAFETIEHVPDPDIYLGELKRVLKPSGRLMVCAPNNWVDETGKDPNPYHLHIYTWERLIDECGSQFLLEKGFFQTAGGAMRYHHSPRSWVEVVPEKVREQDGEWVLLLCMADPIDGMPIPYEETAWSLPDSLDFHVSAFARGYENPWIVRSMVAIGMRAQSETLLSSMRQRVLAASNKTSADFGAAFCGQIYALMRENSTTDACFQEVRNTVLQYAAIEAPTPQQLRWQVSLLFAGGELAKNKGNVQVARDFYSRCAALDVMPYSPLLGNKTLDALYWLTVMAVADRDLKTAKAHLERSIGEATRLVSASWLNIIGVPEKPLPFGFPEVSQLMDKAARAAYMLDLLGTCESKPGLFYRESLGFFERQLGSAAVRKSELEASVSALAQQAIDTEARAQNLGQKVVELDAHAQELARNLARAQNALSFYAVRGIRFVSHRISNLITKKKS